MIVKNVQKSDAMICVLNALYLSETIFSFLFFREKDSLIVFQNGFGLLVDPFNFS